MAEKKEKRAQLKITDSKWEQSFIISHLPSFVAGRLDNYKQGKEYQRIGNWIGVRGDMQTINSLMVDTLAVEGFGSMNSAQASALVPRVSLNKVPTPAARALVPDLPLQVPLAFSDHSSAVTAHSNWFSARHPDQQGAGIKDISVTQKFVGPGVNMSQIEISFSFDSMKTFVSNQKKGVGFLDLIPTDYAMIETGGTADVLWYLQLTLGWALPPTAGTLFDGAQGKKVLDAIEATQQTWQLGYGGEHSINVQHNGSVELKVKYYPLAKARDLTGMNSHRRVDVLGSTKRSTSGDHRKSISSLTEDLKAAEKKVKEFTDEYKKLKTARSKEIVKIQEEIFKQQKALAEAQLNAEPPSLVIMKSMGFQADPALDPNNPEDKKKIDKAYAKFKSENDWNWPSGLGMGGSPLIEHPPIALGDYRKIQAQLQSGLKAASSAYDNKFGTLRNKKELVMQEIHDITQKLEKQRNHSINVDAKEDQYASFLRELFMRGSLHYLEFTPKEIKTASYGLGNLGTAHTKFKYWRNELQKRIGVGTDAGALDAPEQNHTGTFDATTAKAFEAAVLKALGNPPDTSKIMTAAVNREAVDPNLSAAKINNKRIYYFYLGDLLTIVMDHYYENMKQHEHGDTTRQAFKMDSLMLGDFYYNTYPKDGKPRRKNPEATVLARAYHLGDFPIALSTFTKFFAERFMSAGYSAIPLDVFLEELVVYLFSSEALTATEEHSYGPFLNPYLPAQRFDMFYDQFSTPCKLERGIAQQFRVGGFYDTSTATFRGGPHGTPWKPSPEELQAAAEGKGQLYNYFVLGPEPIESSPARPSFTIFLGTETSFIKDVRYNQQKNNEHLQSEMIIKGATSGNGLIRLGNMMMYEVELTCLGAPFFKPGQCFELNNNIFGMAESQGLEAFGESLDDLLPRIIIVSEVNHKFSGHSFETKVKALPSGTTYKDFVEGKGESLISNLPRPGTARAGSGGRGSGNINSARRPFGPPTTSN